MKTLNNCIVEENRKNEIIICADEKTDYFIDNLTKYKVLNAPYYYEEIDWDFECKVMVKPEFISTYDAGGIFIMDSESKWIKLAFEKTDLGYTSIVTVVTEESSDDSNGEKIDGEFIWLRIIRKGEYWAIHYSENGTNWKMVRYFSLKMNVSIKVGIISQSPIGKGCRVKFNNFEITQNRYSNIRSGC